MSSDDKFWLIAIGILCLAFDAGVLIGCQYWDNTNAKVVELIKNGVPATEALCALQNDYGTHPVCIVRAMK